MVDLRVGRVHVFLLHAFRTRVEQSATEGHHPAAHVQPGKDHTTGIAVAQAAVTFAVALLLSRHAESCLLQELRLIARLQGCLSQSVTLLQRIAQVELLYDVVADATTAEILLTDGDTVGIVLHHLLEIVHRPLIDDKHRLALALLLLLLVGQLLLLDLDIIFLRQPA